MATPVIFTPVITDDGKAAAIAADNLGLELELTHVAFGTAAYEPTGLESALTTEVKRVTIAGGSRVSSNQIRMSAVWQSATDNYPINEVGFFAGSTLFAVWSRASGGAIGYKTPGVDFVMFNDLIFNQIPADSVTVVVDTDVSVALAALSAHEANANAHPAYVRKDSFPDAQQYMLASTVGGTANAITLAMPIDTVIPAYVLGQEIRFFAAVSNTGAVTVNVNSIGVKNVYKNGNVPLASNDIMIGSAYSIVYDGSDFQIIGGVGGGAQTLTGFNYTATAAQTTFAATYTVGMVMVFVNGRYQQAADFTATNGTSVVLANPCVVGDEVTILAVQSFLIADTYTIAQADAKFALSNYIVKNTNFTAEIGKRYYVTASIVITCPLSSNADGSTFEMQKLRGTLPTLNVNNISTDTLRLATTGDSDISWGWDDEYAVEPILKNLVWEF